MKYRLRYAFMNFMWKNSFLKAPRKRIVYGITDVISVFARSHQHPCLSFQAELLYLWSVYFLNSWHLASPVPAPEWSFLDKTHKLCTFTSRAARRGNHKNAVCWGGWPGGVHLSVCIPTCIRFETGAQIFSSEVCVRTAALVLSLVGGVCL